MDEMRPGEIVRETVQEVVAFGELFPDAPTGAF